MDNDILFSMIFKCTFFIVYENYETDFFKHLMGFLYIYAIQAEHTFCRT